MEALGVGNDDGELLGVFGGDEVDLRELAEGGEVLEQGFVFERGDEGVVVRYVAE